MKKILVALAFALSAPAAFGEGLEQHAMLCLSAEKLVKIMDADGQRYRLSRTTPEGRMYTLYENLVTGGFVLVYSPPEKPGMACVLAARASNK